MSQQLNLYGPAFRKAKHWLNARNGLRATLVVLALCAMVGGTLTWLSGRGQADPAEQLVLAQQRAMLASLQDQVNAQRSQVDAEAARLREVEAALARVRSTLQGGLPGDKAVSYAEYFQALANQAQSSLWITAFSISPDGSAIELKGRMLDAAALPDYLSRLNAEPVFKGRQFEQLQMAQVALDGGEAGQQVTEFVLRTASDGKEAAR